MKKIKKLAPQIRVSLNRIDLINIPIKVLLSLDRIDFSLPEHLLYHLENYLEKQGIYLEGDTSEDDSDRFKGEYWKSYYRRTFRYHKRNITLRIPKADFKMYQRRFFMTVPDPDEGIQHALRNLFYTLSDKGSEGSSDILIKEVEVAVDCFADNDEALNEIKKFIRHHLVVKYARDFKVRIRRGLRHFGLRGSAHNGSKGVRDYPKRSKGGRDYPKCSDEGEENPKSRKNKFFRFEVQFNRPHHYHSRLSIDNLPLNPFDFQLFDKIWFKDNFSREGITNVSRTVLRKKGITKDSHGNYRNILIQKERDLKARIIGGSRGKKRIVAYQIEHLKKYLKKERSGINPHTYFKELNDFTEILSFLSSVHYPEPFCSKRVCYCKNQEILSKG